MSNGTEPQAEDVREIVNAPSYDEVKTRIDALNASAWTKTVEDITEWNKIKNKFYKTSNDIPLEYAEKRLSIRNRVRVRLGYPEVDEYGLTTDSQTFVFPSCSVNKNAGW